MHSRNWSSIPALVAVVLFVFACAAPAPVGTPAPEAAAPAATPGPQNAGSVAILMTGPWDDNSWNGAGYDALQALKKKGIKVSYAESVAEAGAEPVLRDYAGQGYELVLGHSFGYQDATFKVAQAFPDVNFAWAGGIQHTGKNVADYDQPFYEAAYLIGIVGGYMSKTGHLGALYGFDIPVCHSMGEAMYAGARTVNPQVRFTPKSVDDWVDAAKAKELALAQADDGVDFWIECGEGPAQGAIDAAKERGGFVTGYAGDMTERGPSVVLVNLAWNLEPLITKMLDDIHSGKFDNSNYRFGVAEDSVQVKYNDALKPKIPAEALKAVEQATADIKSGKLKVPFVAGAS